MPDLSEYGDIVFTTLDEWGNRKIDGLLEDGTKILIVVVGWIERSVSEVLGAVSDSVLISVRRVKEISEPSISVADSPATAKVFLKEATESLGVPSDSVGVNIRRDRQISEPSISIADATERLLRRDRQPLESLGLVTDVTERLLRRDRNISESLGVVTDSVVYVLRRERQLSEPTISISDLVLAQIWMPLIERSVSEPAISIADDVVKQLIRARAISESLGVGVYDSVLITSNGKILLRLSPATKTPPNYLEVG